MVLLAVLLILISIFAPRVAAIRGLRARVRALEEGEPEYAVINDPTRENGDILGGRGCEVQLSRGDSVAVCSYIAKIADDCALVQSKRDALSAWDTHVIVKTASGEIVQIYVTEESFYYSNNGKICEFCAKDTELYAAFYAFIQGAFK